jgi:hypothetical protein
METTISSFDTTSLSSASDTEDVWTISDEQREYYTTQFKAMQTDVEGLIHGSDAKVVKSMIRGTLLEIRIDNQ